MNTVGTPSTTSTGVPEQSIRWMGLSLRVPGDWHLRKHGVSPNAGQLVFVDRQVQRMEIVWNRPDREPDTVRMVKHAVETLQNDQPELHIATQLPHRLPGWNGFSYDAPPRTCRALYYHPEYNVLLQVTLSLEGIREETHRQVREILSALAVAENPDAATHWRAFGLEVRVPAACVLSQAKVHPMDVTLGFDYKLQKKRRFTIRGSVTLRRLGMAGDWFDGDLEAYAKRRTSGLRSEIRRTADNPAVCRADSRVGKSGFAGKIGFKHLESLQVWHDPVTNSLFELTLRNIPNSEDMLTEIQVEGVAEWLANATPSPSPAIREAGAERDRLVEGIPVRNAAVIEESAPEGAVLRVPLQPRWWTRGLIRWIFPIRDSRAFGMDAFGAEVWSDCDGERTVESICERFARRHAVSYDEAKAAVYQFLQTLTRRELILIQLPQNRSDLS